MTAAAKYLSQGMEQEEFTYRQAMNVSGDKQELFQRKEQLLSEWMGRHSGSSLPSAIRSRLMSHCTPSLYLKYVNKMAVSKKCHYRQESYSMHTVFVQDRMCTLVNIDLPLYYAIGYCQNQSPIWQTAFI